MWILKSSKRITGNVLGKEGEEREREERGRREEDTYRTD